MTGNPQPPGHDSTTCQKNHCHGQLKQGDGTCTRPAGWGTPHPGIGKCKLHGGSTESHKKAAENVVAERAVVTFGLPRDIDHHSALLEELHRTAGAVAWLGQQVAGLESKDVVWGKTRRKKGGDDHGVTHEAGVNVWVKLWQGERRHLLDVTKACHAAGIDERRMQLAEAAGEQLALVLRAVFARLMLSDEQLELVATVVPEELRKLAALTGGESVADAG